MEGVPSANNYQGGFGTKLMAKVSGSIFFLLIILFTPRRNWIKTRCVHRILVLLRIRRPIPRPQFLLVLWHTRSTVQCALVATLTKTFPPSSSFYVKRGYSRSSESEPDFVWEMGIMSGWFSLDMHACLFWKGCYRFVRLQPDVDIENFTEPFLTSSVWPVQTVTQACLHHPFTSKCLHSFISISFYFKPVLSQNWF